MDEKIWSVAELEQMTPSERREISKAAVVRDLSKAPQNLVEDAINFVEERIAAEEAASAS